MLHWAVGRLSNSAWAVAIRQKVEGKLEHPTQHSSDCLACAAVAVDEPAGGRVPDVHALVEGAGGDVLAVRGEGHGVDGLLQVERT